MTANKRTVERYLEGFRRSNHEQILSCLTDDVEWEIPGVFRVVGKAAFDAEIENPAFVGSPTIETKRVIEEADVVVAEGSVLASRADGGQLNAVFCDIFLNARWLDPAPDFLPDGTQVTACAMKRRSIMARSPQPRPWPHLAAGVR